MGSRQLESLLGTGIIITLIVAVIFIILQWLQLPAGHFADWLVGIASFWWLLVIVTIPWNIHFEARRLLDEASRSKEANISVKEDRLQVVQKIAQRSLWGALALHVVSALGLYGLAFYGVSAIGYVSSGAALLLTAFRPAVRGYEYIANMLATIGQEFKYPRHDVNKLKQEVSTFADRIAALEDRLNTRETDSWASQQVAHLNQLEQEIKTLQQQLREFQYQNQLDHERLPREFQQAISQVAPDRELLNHIRELIRFFKQA